MCGGVFLRHLILCVYLRFSQEKQRREEMHELHRTSSGGRREQPHQPQLQVRSAEQCHSGPASGLLLCNRCLRFNAIAAVQPVCFVPLVPQLQQNGGGGAGGQPTRRAGSPQPHTPYKKAPSRSLWRARMFVLFLLLNMAAAVHSPLLASLSPQGHEQLPVFAWVFFTLMSAYRCVLCFRCVVLSAFVCAARCRFALAENSTVFGHPCSRSVSIVRSFVLFRSLGALCWMRCYGTRTLLQRAMGTVVAVQQFAGLLAESFLALRGGPSIVVIVYLLQPMATGVLSGSFECVCAACAAVCRRVCCWRVAAKSGCFPQSPSAQHPRMRR